jgi:hypothetical protein
MPIFARLAAAPFLALLAVLLAGGLVTPAAAQDFFEAPRPFVVERACDATRSIRGAADPTPLTVGTTYEARGVNRREAPTHAFVRVGDANKWVALDCGRLAEAAAGAAGAGAAAGAGGPAAAPTTGPRCLPFFDDLDNPIPRPAVVGGRADITPRPPRLDDFDRALMATCGPAGKVVPRTEFAAMMRAHPAVLARLRAFTGGRVFADRPVASDDAVYLADLTEAWFALKGFDHIVCGEPNEPARGGGKTIGGLHFHGRFLQLQQSGEACRMDNYDQNEVVDGVIYTMGVEMRAAGGAIARHARKGYGLTLGGEDLLKVVTRAFADNPTPSTESTACLLPVTDEGKAFTAVFVRRAAGIRTFFPDATPNGRGERRNPPCAGPVDLR